jgi:hypothetical protein
MPENSEHKTTRTLIIPEYEWGGGGGGNTGKQNTKCYKVIMEVTVVRKLKHGQTGKEKRKDINER